MAKIENYEGREQSFIKHQFLTKYLESAAYKTMQGHSPIFNFVDAFAGPWSVSDENDYSDASFHQAIKTLETVRSSLGRMGKSGLKIRFCFCEKNKSSFEKLSEYCKQKNEFEIHVFHGSFEEHLDNIAKVCSDGFTFTFIDPTGWDIDSARIFSFLRKRGGESLINFMSNDINRFPNFEKVAAAYGRLLADPSWKTDFDNLPETWKNEEKILFLFKKKIKSSNVAKFVPDIIIQDRIHDRIKMRLVLTTFSSKGLELFRDVQEKVEKQEMAIRDQTKNKSNQQVALFNEDIFAQMQQDEFGVGCASNKSKARKAIVIILQKNKKIKFQKLSNLLIEKYPLRTKHVKEILSDMKDSNLLFYELPKGRRVPQPNTVISFSEEK